MKESFALSLIRRGKRIARSIDNDAMKEYAQALYERRRNGKRIAVRFRNNDVVNYLSKYPNFAETEKVKYRPTVDGYVYRLTNTAM